MKSIVLQSGPVARRRCLAREARGQRPTFRGPTEFRDLFHRFGVESRWRREWHARCFIRGRSSTFPSHHTTILLRRSDPSRSFLQPAARPEARPRSSLTLSMQHDLPLFPGAISVVDARRLSDFERLAEATHPTATIWLLGSRPPRMPK